MHIAAYAREVCQLLPCPWATAVRLHTRSMKLRKFPNGDIAQESEQRSDAIGTLTMASISFIRSSGVSYHSTGNSSAEDVEGP
jgi:hypothetical protein